MIVEEGQVIGTILRNNDAIDIAGDLSLDSFVTREFAVLFSKVMMDYGMNRATTINAIMAKVDSDREAKALQVAYEAAANLSTKDFERAVAVLKRNEALRKLEYVVRVTKEKIDDKVEPNLIVESAINELLTVLDTPDGEQAIITPQQAASEAAAALQHRMDNPDELLGIPLHYTDERGTIKGFPFIYEYMQGLKQPDLYIIAGKTGTGKSGLGSNIARIMAFEHGKRVWYGNGEMDAVSLTERFIAADSLVSLKEIKTGKFEGMEREKKARHDRVKKSLSRLEESELYLSKLPMFKPSKVARIGRQMKNLYGQLDVIIVDYLGRMESESGKRNNSTWDDLYDITKSLKQLAVSLEVPVILLAQLNDEGKLEGAKKVLNEADVGLYWEEIDKEDEKHQKRMDEAGIDNYEKASHTLYIRKVRDGAGEGEYIHFKYMKSFQFITQVQHTKKL